MLLRTLKKKHGQSIAVEYAVLFFIVVAIVAAMTTYVKRAVQGRVHDARQYMYAQVNATYRDMYPDRVLPNGYAPYYLRTTTDKAESTVTSQHDTPWAGHEGKFESGISSTVDSTTTSVVAPANQAD